MIPSFYGVIEREEYRPRPSIERALRAGRQNEIVRNILYRLNPAAWIKLNNFLAQHIQTRLEPRSVDIDDEPHLHYYFQDTNGSLELSCAGAGLINLVALYASLELSRLELRSAPLIFLLDEPEAHLHPRLQGDMVEAIASLIQDRSSQIIMATHSVEIINRTRYMNQGALVLMERAGRAPRSVHGSAELLRELDKWADLTPFAAMSFLSARRLLFYEGSSDKALLDACASVLLMHSDESRRRRYESWTARELGGIARADLLATWTRLLKTPWWSHQVQGLEICVVLDRDYDLERAVGQAATDREGGIALTRHVWPQHSIESLFCEARVLTSWMLAWLQAVDPDGPLTRDEAKVREAVVRAINAADRDPALCQYAVGQLLDPLLRGHARTAQELIHAHREASERVKAQPHIWQRGKDRARYVLGELHEWLNEQGRASLKFRLPKELVKLVGRVHQTPEVPISSEAVPAPIASLIQWLIAQ
jgi:hypothetical protein